MMQKIRSYLFAILIALSLPVSVGYSYSQAQTSGFTVGPQLLKDITVGTASFEPAGLFAFGDLLLFSPYAVDYDDEPWVTDGTLEGTHQLRDINPDGFSNPSFLIENDGLVYFSATSTSTGRELWKTDGTTGGTVLVADLATGTPSSNPHSLVSLGTNFYFIASPGGTVSGERLFRSDGSASGTVQVTDMDLRAKVLGTYHDHVYFLASTGGEETGLGKLPQLELSWSSNCALCLAATVGSHLADMASQFSKTSFILGHMQILKYSYGKQMAVWQVHKRSVIF